MAILNTYVQHPGEVKQYRIDYSRWLDSSKSEVIQAMQPMPDITVLNDDSVASDTLTVNVTQFVNENTAAEYIVSGGVDGVNYELEFSMTTTLGQVTKNKVVFRIKAI